MRSRLLANSEWDVLHTLRKEVFQPAQGLPSTVLAYRSKALESGLSHVWMYSCVTIEAKRDEIRFLVLSATSQWHDVVSVEFYVTCTTVSALVLISSVNLST